MFKAHYACGVEKLDLEIKHFWLNLYCHYKSCQSYSIHILDMPGIILDHTFILFNALTKQPVKWSDQQKPCSLMIDDMSLKKC